MQENVSVGMCSIMRLKYGSWSCGSIVTADFNDSSQ